MTHQHSDVRFCDIDQFLSTYKPGSQGPTWTWVDEAADLLSRDRDQINELARGIRDGWFKQWQQPVLVGDDGRVWDGHHRVIAIALSGRSVIFYREATSPTETERPATQETEPDPPHWLRMDKLSFP